MLEFIEGAMNVIVSIISDFGYWGIGVGMMLESACIPLPSEVVLPLGGNMVAKGILSMLGANVAVNVGSIIGSLIAYTVGFYGGRSFILKYGKYFFISSDHFYKAEKSFNRYGSTAVFVGRLLPVIRTFISLPAGIAKMNVKKFVVYSLLGMIPWNFVLIYLGCKFGQQYENIVRPMFKRFEHVVIVVILLCIIFILFKLFFKKDKTIVQ